MASGIRPKRAADGNAGLWFDKFCDQWTTGWTMQAEKSARQDSNPKLSWLNTLTGQPIGNRSDLEEVTARLIRLSQAQGGVSLIFRGESRFVTGLGRSHPVENGFAWHPTLGTPFLPRSSIKGMVRSWASSQADPQPDEACLRRVFGAPGQSGSVCFLDAVPIAPVQVEADVLTPHAGGWSPTDPPGDWRSPVPVPFLVTAQGLTLLFTVVPCGEVHAGDLEQVETWLIDALSWAGAGAKTAVGYGRMALDRQKTEELVQADRQERVQKEEARIEAERLASLDPLDREFEELAAAEPAMAPYRVWIKAVESGRWNDQPAVLRMVLARIEAAMRKLGAWKEVSNKKNPSKDKEFQSTRQVMDLKARHQ